MRESGLFGLARLRPEQRVARLLAEKFLGARITPAIFIMQREQRGIAEVEPQHDNQER
jgi:hypothetical protein